jgi:transcriptional regulator with XRE-family HTH domain
MAMRIADPTEAPMAISPKRIGNKIKSLRALKELLQQDLSARSGLTQNQISSIENGRAQTVENLELVAEALGMTLWEFFKSIEEDEDKGAA